MKMKWFDRVLLALALVLLFALSVFTIGIALGVFRAAFVDFYNLMTNGVWVNAAILAAAGVVVFLIALRLLVASCSHKHAPDLPTTVLLKTTDNGSIRIALSAIDTMVQRAARSSSAVRDVASRILVNENDALLVQLRISFVPDTVVQDATAQIQSEVREYVQVHSGVPVNEVQVFVDAVGAAQMSRAD